MERKDFLRAGALFTGAALITRDVHAAQDIQNMGLDKLVDAEGNFVTALNPMVISEDLHRLLCRDAAQVH